MFYFGFIWKPHAFDTFACSHDLVNWTKWDGANLVEPSEPFDKTFAHKPWVLKHDGVVYHYYCAVGDQGRVIALATSRSDDMKNHETDLAGITMATGVAAVVACLLAFRFRFSCPRELAGAPDDQSKARLRRLRQTRRRTHRRRSNLRWKSGGRRGSRTSPGRPSPMICRRRRSPRFPVPKAAGCIALAGAAGKFTSSPAWKIPARARFAKRAKPPGRASSSSMSRGSSI